MKPQVDDEPLNRSASPETEPIWRELMTEATRELQAQPWLLRLLNEHRWQKQRGAALYWRFQAAYRRLQGLRPGQLRRLQRKLGMGLAGAALLLTLSGGPVYAAGITVDAGGVCTLAEAITSANNDNAAGNGCVNGSGADTITLQTNVNLTSALPAIASAITIEGGGYTIQRTVGAAFGILKVNSGASLTINGATISGGSSGGGRGNLECGNIAGE